MSAFLDKLIELLFSSFWHLMPFCIMGDDECGLIRRFGKYRRNMRAGVNWKWPLCERPMVESAALGSMTLREQTLTTRDKKQITLRGVLTWRVVDPKAYILGCDNAQSVVNDVGACVIAEEVPELDAWDLMNGDAQERLTKKMRVRARRWGIKVESFGLVDCVLTRAYRVITNAPIDIPSA